jgi:DNA-binding protein H-NS
MEEDIKILEEMLKDKEQIIKYHCWIGTKSIDAIENLLKRYKELEEENKKYPIKLNDEIYRRVIENAQKEFIPISVIQNKKRELEEERSNKLTKNDGWDEYREYAIEVLEDILEKGNKEI